jgi:mRNA interferase HigB
MGTRWRASSLRIFSRATLIEFWRKHPEAEGALRLWFSMVERAAWTTPADVRTTFWSADFVANERVIFDIKGNKFRLVAQVRYAPIFVVVKRQRELTPLRQ